MFVPEEPRKTFGVLQQVGRLATGSANLGVEWSNVLLTILDGKVILKPNNSSENFWEFTLCCFELTENLKYFLMMKEAILHHLLVNAKFQSN